MDATVSETITHNGKYSVQKVMKSSNELLKGDHISSDDDHIMNVDKPASMVILNDDNKTNDHGHTIIVNQSSNALLINSATRDHEPIPIVEDSASNDLRTTSHIAINHDHIVDEQTSDEMQKNDNKTSDNKLSVVHKLPHCLVETIDVNKMTVIFANIQNSAFSRAIQRASITLKEGQIYCVYQYIPCGKIESPKDKLKSLKKASKFVKRDIRLVPITNDWDFVMLCKRGSYCTWEKVERIKLRPGDHIVYHGEHAIVAFVNNRYGYISCYKNTFRGVKGNVIFWNSKFNRVVYNSMGNNDDVICDAKSRLGEKEYNQFTHNDRHFAETCKMGFSVGFFKRERKETCVVIKELLLSADKISEGDQIAWTRVGLYDHHALVKKVIKEEKRVEVFEMIKNESTKRLVSKELFNGKDPVYKVNHIPERNRTHLLKEVELRVKQPNQYNLATNNCENFAANLSSWAPQVKSVFSFVGGTIIRKLPIFVPSLFLEVIADEVARKRVTIALNLSVGFIPLLIEIVCFLWDIHHDYRDHMITRGVVGFSGTVLTIIPMCIAASLPLSLGLSILVASLSFIGGVIASTCTTLIMRAICRYLDKRKCQTAYGVGLKEVEVKTVNENTPLIKENTPDIP